MIARRQIGSDRLRRARLPLAICMIFIASTLWTQGASAQQDPTPESGANTERGEVHNILLMAHRGQENALQRWSSTADYLTARIPGHRFELVPLDWDGMRAYIQTGEADFVLSNPSMYVEFEAGYGIRRLATLKNLRMGNAVPRFGSVIFKRADRDDIQGVEDLRGKHLSMASHLSWGGWQVGWMEMLSQGFDPHEELGALSASGNHDKTVLAVLAGEVDVGICRTDTLERMAERGEIDLGDIDLVTSKNALYPGFPFLLSTDLYPEWPFAAAGDVDVDLMEEVARALLNLPGDSQAARDGSYAGWTVPDNYQPVHEALRTLHVRPYEHYGEITLEGMLREYWPLFVAAVVLLIGLATWNVRFRRMNRRLQETQGQLRLATQEAEEANRAKSAFLANMSHELRTPMNAILGYSEMLMEDAEDDGREEIILDLKKIHQAGTHLLALINDVLDLSKIEAGRMQMFAEHIDIDALIDQVVGTAQPLIGKNDNRLCIERGDDLGAVLQDVTKLKQSLLNLLSNAAKFTKDGTITLSTKRSAEQAGEWLIFDITDTGIGIPEDRLDRVFEEFGQADESTTRNYGGTGLGLPISRQFCQMMGGDLTLMSRPGVGSTFTIRVPAVLPGSETPTPVDAAGSTSETDIATMVSEGSEHTVLVIDDDPAARELVGRSLAKDGLSVAFAASGEEGLRLARALRPAAITLDVLMPNMDGWSVLRALKSDPSMQDIPVIMLTIMADRNRGFALGAADYFTKPVDRDLLREALRRYRRSGDRSTVLLVEDDLKTREVMARTLDKANWQVIEAGNGREALDRLAETRPDLILLDLMMPVMDGFDFLLELRAHPDWWDIPVVVLTAKELTEEDRQVLSGRVEQVIEKGALSAEQLIRQVRQLLPA